MSLIFKKLVETVKNNSPTEKKMTNDKNEQLVKRINKNVLIYEKIFNLLYLKKHVKITSIFYL